MIDNDDAVAVSGGAMPVQQATQTLRRPKWKTTTLQMRWGLDEAVSEFCKNGGYERRELIDVALREYMKLPEPSPDEL